jgi:hypothetical protein
LTANKPPLTFLDRNRNIVAATSHFAEHPTRFSSSHIHIPTITMSIELDPPELGFKREFRNLAT